MSLTKNSKPKFVENKECKVYNLDLPESILNCILECLLPVDLCSVSKVCTSLRHRCRSDDLWARHIKQKWGSLLGDAAHREWQWHVTTIVNKKKPLLQLNGEGLLGSFSGSWPLSSLGSYLENPGDLTSLLLSNCSMMALYISLQNGRFRFPAQVYRKWQHGRLYDALLSYDYITNTFRARSPTDGWQVIEESVGWERLRPSPIEAHPYALYTSQCWKDLKPGDHIEIQRKSLMHEPYGNNFKFNTFNCRMIKLF
ncbi:hypothetical protein Fmac_029622 [Flemingia macrophylla]|uniref:F-box domain-containing protein n=1 Tax=Flemingia macrophylla TaxID=520843 RepID=A0ABD1LAV4_9FABA